MSKRVAIIQSSYIPWKGYFDMIRAADEFILLDDVQYSKGSWRNRNRIKTVSGIKWLTIPVKLKSNRDTVDSVTIADRNWGRRHWNSLVHHYSKAPCFAEYAEPFKKLYLENEEEYLSRINYRFIREITGMLGIVTSLSWSSDYPSAGNKSDKVLSLCRATGAGVYISGPSAKEYLDEKKFNDEGIRVEWFDYAGYPEYPQLYPPFEHNVTILDLLFNTGNHALDYMKSTL